MIGYVPGSTVAHRLDPRAKLAVQVAFAAAAFAYTTPRGLAVLSVLALAVTRLASLSLASVARSFRVFFPFLVAAPLVATVQISPPAIDPEAAVYPALSSYRVLLVVAVSAAYVRTTTVRESRAAIQRTVPGRPGVFLGVGVSLVFRFLPLIRREITAVREASAARLGTERPLIDRIERVAVAGATRTLRRADRLSTALSARCFAWNPTLPRLSLTRMDVPALALAGALLAATLFRAV
ncbi:cobalt transporter [Halorubrum californiense DSM 19288]|uniref:Cobalt transporter n=1 Tax=Halorubrum californiense DSM 19288 TaxID=1227465 RepID=M0EA22_9EURY|nr:MULTISPECIES: energy-coupling factor transporter transmembrane protein EcfT [Halorubrum]ELZ43898.1 cobalt transporter [Halorubrum californiense DSM 19288]TKX71255.1 energy-coupling factor transporter transmembrane protein EcfT [Halorubrum sp. GN11GM_10-3_MGM]